MDALMASVVTTDDVITNEFDNSLINFEKLSTDTRFLSNDFVDIVPLEPVSLYHTWNERT